MSRVTLLQEKGSRSTSELAFLGFNGLQDVLAGGQILSLVPFIAISTNDRDDFLFDRAIGGRTSMSVGCMASRAFMKS